MYGELYGRCTDVVRRDAVRSVVRVVVPSLWRPINVISLESSRQGDFDRLYASTQYALTTISVLLYYWLEVSNVMY